MHTFQPGSTFHTRVCRRTRAILAQMHLILAAYLATFGSNFWVNKHRAALFLVSFFRLLLCAPYLRLILAQTSMKPMQMIRERKVSCGGGCRQKKTIAEHIHLWNHSRAAGASRGSSCIFAPLFPAEKWARCKKIAAFLWPMFTKQKSKSFAF